MLKLLRIIVMGLSEIFYILDPKIILQTFAAVKLDFTEKVGIYHWV